MENYFICPHCGGHLKVGDYIIFKVKNPQKEFGLLLLHPEIGNYTSIKHPKFQYEKGDAVDFYCPLCSHSLSTDFDENLTYVVMTDKQGKEYDIYFSRIAGEQSTYQVSGDTVKASGEHSSKYTYFRMSDRFKRFLKK
jgi:hypothetical protein